MNFISIWSDFVDLIFPRCCEACMKSLIGNEEVICTSCRIGLPRIKTDSIFSDTLNDKFAHMPAVAGTTAFLLFTKKGKVQKLLHALKYKGRPEVGLQLGYMFGQEMSDGNYVPDAELVVSVPLHKKKKKSRGFNQSDLLAEGFSNATGIPWSGTALERTVNTVSQTGKTKKERRENVKNVFFVKERIAAKSVIVIDDVLTTGATLEACIEALQTAGCETFYVMTIAVAQH